MKMQIINQFARYVLLFFSGDCRSRRFGIAMTSVFYFSLFFINQFAQLCSCIGISKSYCFFLCLIFLAKARKRKVFSLYYFIRAFVAISPFSSIWHNRKNKCLLKKWGKGHSRQVEDVTLNFSYIL
jgi:hypothetical protein